MFNFIGFCGVTVLVGAVYFLKKNRPIIHNVTSKPNYYEGFKVIVERGRGQRLSHLSKNKRGGYTGFYLVPNKNRMLKRGRGL